MNTVRTTALLAAMTVLFMAVGFVVGGRVGMILALGFALVTNLIAFWNSDKLVLRMQQARPLGRNNATELYAMLDALSARAGIPTPALYLIETDQPNAFATGRSPENAAVAVSRGLVNVLDRRELAAVISHELAHIRNRDTLTMTLTATLAGAITMLAQFGFWFGDRNSNSPLGPFGGILAFFLAPLAAALVQMAVSRTREYEADRDGAMISGDPLALATALEKISALARNFENPWARRNPGMAHLYIVNPLAGRGQDNLFATHPDVRNRIAELMKIAEDMGSAPTVDSTPRRRSAPDIDTSGPSWRVPQTRSEPHRPGPWG
jgi:heat shock protein HtpX